MLERYILAANSVFNFVNEHQLDKLNQNQLDHLRTVVNKIHDKLKPENFNPNATKITKNHKKVNTRRRYDNANL